MESLRVVVTLDTEADDQWHHGGPLTTENVRWWQPFQDLCARHGARPTYLITSEIAEDDRAAAFLSPLVTNGVAEVGAHLHPWTTPPFRDEPGLAWNDPAHAYPCHVDEGLLQDKLVTLTAQIGESLGVTPTAFRAGRFGIDHVGARLLAKLGYVVDSSITPFVSWSGNAGRPGRGGGPDFRRRHAYPFRVAGSGAPGLVELPVTILPTYAVTRHCRTLLDHWDARPLRLVRRGLRAWGRPQPLWLRPRPEYDLDDLLALIGEARRLLLPSVVLMFHSSELMPGGSPYRPTQGAVDDLLSVLDALFASLRRSEARFLTLSEAGRELARFDRLPTGEL